MEQQSMLIDGEGYDVAGATIKAIRTGDNGKPVVRIVDRVTGARPVREVLPRQVEWIAYDLVSGSPRRIETLWIDERGDE